MTMILTPAISREIFRTRRARSLCAGKALKIKTPAATIRAISSRSSAVSAEATRAILMPTATAVTTGSRQKEIRLIMILFFLFGATFQIISQYAKKGICRLETMMKRIGFRFPAIPTTTVCQLTATRRRAETASWKTSGLGRCACCQG